MEEEGGGGGGGRQWLGHGSTLPQGGNPSPSPPLSPHPTTLPTHPAHSRIALACSAWHRDGFNGGSSRTIAYRIALLLYARTRAAPRCAAPPHALCCALATLIMAICLFVVVSHSFSVRGTARTAAFCTLPARCRSMTIRTCMAFAFSGYESNIYICRSLRFFSRGTSFAHLFAHCTAHAHARCCCCCTPLTHARARRCTPHAARTAIS